MLNDLYHDLESTTLNAPVLCVPLISGISVPANVAPDALVTNAIVIPMHLTAFGGPSSQQVLVTTTLPIITDSGLTYGGQALSHPSKILPRRTLEGFMDTPCTSSGEYFISQITDSSGVRYSYADLIAMMIEGRTNMQGDGTWTRVDPYWYRDPYGRVYLSPRIIDFTATYVEGVPERNQFTMILKVT